MIQLLINIIRILQVYFWLVGFFILFSYPACCQEKWLLSNPTEIRNGNFFVKSPKNSEKFFLFGYDVQVWDLINNDFESLPPLPNEILYKEATTGISAPYRHTQIFTYSEQKWWTVHEGNIYRTTDAGNQWEKVLSLHPNTQFISSSYFTDIHFPSEKIGYAVGTADKIFRTLDGGTTWQELQWSNSTAPYRRLSSVHFVTENVGFAMGYEVENIQLNIGAYKPFYYFTTDAGLSWQETTFPESDHHFVDIEIVWDETWYLSVRNRNFISPADKLFRSTDGGNNWESVSLPGISSLSTLVIRDMHWFTPDEGVILGSTEFFGIPNHVYKTKDGGKNWVKIELDAGIAPFFGKVSNLVMEFNGDKGIIAGATGNVLYSNDKGDTWQSLRKGLPDISDISSDASLTFAAFYGNLLMKHEGNEWTKVELPANSQPGGTGLTKVRNLGKDNIALINVYGDLLRTNDGGITWKNLFSSSDTTVLDIAYENGFLTVLLWSNNKLLFLPDAEAPQKLEEITTNTSRPSSASNIFYVGNKLFIKAERFLFEKTDNIWKIIEIANANTRSFAMDKSGNALIYFINDGYHFSNDLGRNWQKAEFSNEIKDVIDMEISSITGFGQLNDTTHYALVHGSASVQERYHTYILISNNKGKSWRLAEFFLTSEPIEIGRIGHVVDKDGNLWLGTGNGAIYHWLLKETVTSTRETPGKKLEVYPNPNTGRFKIDTPFEVIAYQMYNLQGELVEAEYFDQINEFEIPETYPAGLYILNLITTRGEKKIIKFFKSK